MRIAICDDEKEYRELVRRYVDFYFTEHHIATEIVEFDCGEKLLDSENVFDIAFLDIEMQETNGIQVAKEISKRNKNIVIFIVTAYNSYLDDAMDLNVFRFIDKNSINPTRMYSSLDKAISRINQGEILLRNQRNEVTRISKNDIMYIEAKKRRTYIITNSNIYNSSKPLYYFKEQLMSNYFVVPHNSYIVNLNYIAKYQREKLTMKNGVEIFISQKQQAEMKKILFSYAKDE